MNEHLTELILPAVDAALLDIAANPGPLANRPRQIETFAKLQARQDSADFTSEQKALAYFDIAGGVGKTVLFGQAVQAFRRQGLRVMVVAPRIDLVRQAGDKFEIHLDDDVEATLVHGSANVKTHELNTAGLVVITNQSLTRKFNNGDIKPAEWDVVIYDEAHLIMGPENKKLFEEFKQHAFVMGFTASGEYSEEKTLKDLLGEPVDVISVPDAVTQGLLSSIKTSVVFTRVDIDLESIAAGEDYNKAALERAVNTEARNLKAVATYAQFHDSETGYRMLGERGYAYCAGINHARSIAALFNSELAEALGTNALFAQFPLLQSRDVDVSEKDYDKAQQNLLSSLWQCYEKGEDNLPALPAALIHGGMNATQRKLVHDCFDADLVKVAANADIWTLGIDKPYTSFALNLAPTQSKPVNIQRGTRVDRIDPVNDNKIAYVLDFLDEDVWRRIQDAANDPSKSLKSAPRLFAEVLGWQSAVVNPKVRQEAAEKERLPLSYLSNDFAIALDRNDIVFDSEQLAEIFNSVQTCQQTDRVEITEEMRYELNASMKNKNCGPRKISQILNNKNITEHKIESWKSDVKFCRLQEWNAVIECINLQSSTFVITVAMREKLSALMKEKNCGSGKISSAIKNKDISKGKIEGWRTGQAKSCQQEEWLAVIEYLDSLETALKINGFMRKKLNDLMRQKQSYPTELSCSLKREDINVDKIRNWANGEISSCLLEQWEALVNHLTSKEDGFTITDAMRNELNQLMEEKKCAARKVAKEIGDENITYGRINNWCFGYAKSCKPEEWSRVINHLKSKSVVIEITEDMRKELNQLIHEKNCGAKKISKLLDIKNMRFAKIDDWKAGKVKSCQKDEWDFIIGWLREQPPAAQPVRRQAALGEQIELEPTQEKALAVKKTMPEPG